MEALNEEGITTLCKLLEQAKNTDMANGFSTLRLIKTGGLLSLDILK